MSVKAKSVFAVLLLLLCSCSSASAAGGGLIYQLLGISGHNGYAQPGASKAKFLSPAAIAIDTATTGQIATFVASGGNPEVYTYALSGIDAASFSVDASTGVLSVPVALTAGVKSISVNVTNTAGTQAFPRSVTVNSLPIVAQSLTPASFAADSATTGPIGTAVASGGDPASYTYALSGTDAASFTIGASTGVLSIPVALSAGTKSITIQVTNTAGTANFPRSVVIGAAALVAQSLTPGSVTTTSATTGQVATFVASGGNPNAYTYSLTGADAASFTIDVNTGAFSVPALLSPGTKNVNVLATNSAGTATFARTVLVTDASAVAQSLAPTSVGINTLSTGVVATFVAAGGFPDSYTYGLSGADAASFTINSATGELTVPVVLSAGTKNITITATNTTGGAPFAVVVTVTDVADVYATPDEGTIPTSQQVTITCSQFCTGNEFSNTLFVVSASNVVSIPVSATTYTFKTIIDAAINAGPTKLIFPAGEFTICFSGSAVIDGSIYMIGQVDGSGDPSTKIVPAVRGCTASTSGSIKTIQVADSTYGTVWIKNFYIGPSASMLAGTRLDFTSGGTYQIQPGNVITGATSGATATVSSITITTGSWAAGTAAGVMVLTGSTNTFVAENLNVGANGNVATVPVSGIKSKTGERHINISQSGRINLINDVIRNSRENSLFSSEGDEWNQRRYRHIWIYDSEFMGSGSSANEHNIYLHNDNEYFIRSYTHDTQGAHQYKSADNELLVWYNSACVRDTGIGLSSTDGSASACINTTRTGDNRIANSLVEFDNTTGPTTVSVIDIAQRNANYGGYGLKMPSVVDLQNDTIDFLNALKWGPSFLSESPYWTGQMAATAACASPPCSVTLSVRDIAYDAGGPAFSLTAGTTYVWRFQLNSGATQEFTAVPATVNVGGSSKATVAVTGLLGPINNANAFAVRLAADADWSYRANLNSQYWNPNDPNYWWDTILTGGGVLDLAKQDRFYSSYFEDDLFWINSVGAGNKLVEQVTDNQAEYGYGGVKVAEIPFPPLNNPAGASVAWPNNATYSTWTAPLVNGSTIKKGQNGSVSDWVFPFPAFAADWGVFIQNGNYNQQMQRTGSTDGDWRYLAQNCSNAGHADDYCLNVVTTDASPLSVRGQTTLSGAAAPAARTFTVVNGTQCQNGWRLHMKLTPARGRASVFITDIDQAPGANTIHTADGIPIAAAVGSGISCFAKSGTRPAYWVPPSQYTVN